MRGRKKGYKMSMEQKLAISKSKLGHYVDNKTKLKIGKSNKGKKRSEDIIENIRLRMIGKKAELSTHWLGDKVGKVGVHLWLRRTFGTPNFCEICKSSDKKIYDWANKDHKYKRIRNHFMRLCRSCHRKYDMKHNGYKLGFNK